MLLAWGNEYVPRRCFTIEAFTVFGPEESGRLEGSLQSIDHTLAPYRFCVRTK